jgi:hypothetical protein
MASITTRNSRRSRSITGAGQIDSLETEGLSHSAIKLHSRKMKPTSRVIPAREQYADHMKDDHPQTKLHDAPQPRRYGETTNREYGAIKLSAEIAGVQQALDKMGNSVEKRRKQILDERDKATDEALKPKDFQFQQKSEDLSPKALKAIRKIVREELDTTSQNNGSGFGWSDIAGIGAAAMMGRRAKGTVPSGAPKGPTVVPTVPGLPTPPTTGPKPTVEPSGKPGAPSVVPSAGKGAKPIVNRPAFDRAGRLGNIFQKTAQKKGYGAAMSKVGRLATKNIGGVGAAASVGARGLLGSLGLIFYGADAVMDKAKLDQLYEGGAINEEEYEAAKRELYYKKSIGAGGMLAGGAAGAAAGAFLGPLGIVVGGTIGATLGAFGGESAGEWLNNKTKPEAQVKKNDDAWKKFETANKNAGILGLDRPAQSSSTPRNNSGASAMPKRDKSTPPPKGVVEAIKKVSKEFDVPEDEIISTAERESSFNPLAYNKDSGATGLYQHTKSTWNGLVEKFPDVAEDYDIKKVSIMRDDRKDPYKATVMYAVLRKDNLAIAAGRTTGDPSTDSYLLHLLGASAGRHFIAAYVRDSSQPVNQVRGISAEALINNKDIFISNGRYKTLEEVVQTIKATTASKLKVGKARVEKYLKDTGNSTIATDVSNPTPSTASAVKESSPKTNSMDDSYSHVKPPVGKISTTPSNIAETDAVSKYVREKSATQIMQPIVAPMGIQMPGASTKSSQQTGASLVTRNDNPYLVGVKLQEVLRQK